MIARILTFPINNNSQKKNNIEHRVEGCIKKKKQWRKSIAKRLYIFPERQTVFTQTCGESSFPPACSEEYLYQINKLGCCNREEGL